MADSRLGLKIGSIMLDVVVCQPAQKLSMAD